MARLFGLAVWLLFLLPVPFAQADAGCTFVLGFAGLAANVPQVGRCLDDEAHNPANGDAFQHTTGGLLVWRKADNWTAFTDGAWTWLAGPYGLVRRANSERFSWEAPDASNGPLGTVMLAFGAADAPRHTADLAALVTPALLAQLTADSAPAAGSATGPVPPYALLVQSDGGLPGNLWYALLPGNQVAVGRGNFPALTATMAIQPDGWRIANLACAADASRSLLTIPGGWLGCGLV